MPHKKYNGDFQMNHFIPRACALLCAVSSSAVFADEAKPIKWLLDTRLRVENVDQAGIPEDAHATTLRLRAGFETAQKWNTTLLLEGEGVLPIQTNYRPDPLVADKTQYPVVADPESYEINRFQLVNTSLPGTTVTLGRQRLQLDDQRFIGSSPWRQNEQTFDALRVVNKSVKDLVIDATYFNRVNRVYGPDSPQGHYEGNSGLLNVSYQTKAGKITAFSYLLDFDAIAVAPAAVRDSTSTYGLRFAGERPKPLAAFSPRHGGKVGAHLAEHDHLAARIGLRLQQHRVHADLRLRTCGERLKVLRTADFAEHAARRGHDTRVVAHVLRLERRHSQALARVPPAQRGGEPALAGRAGGTKHHDRLACHRTSSLARHATTANAITAHAACSATCNARPKSFASGERARSFSAYAPGFRRRTPRRSAIAPIGQPPFGEGVPEASFASRRHAAGRGSRRTALKRAGSHESTSSARALHLPAHSQGPRYPHIASSVFATR